MTDKVLKGRAGQIEAIRLDMLRTGNDEKLVNKFAAAVIKLPPGTEAFSAERACFFVVGQELTDTLQIHVRHREENWQALVNPMSLCPVSSVAEGLAHD
jgi:hypothetical protein